jgi:hypothetical protein
LAQVHMFHGFLDSSKDDFVGFFEGAVAGHGCGWDVVWVIFGLKEWVSACCGMRRRLVVEILRMLCLLGEKFVLEAVVGDIYVWHGGSVVVPNRRNSKQWPCACSLTTPQLFVWKKIRSTFLAYSEAFEAFSILVSSKQGSSLFEATIVYDVEFSHSHATF